LCTSLVNDRLEFDGNRETPKRTYVGTASIARGNEAERGLRRSAHDSKDLAGYLTEPPATHSPKKHCPVGANVFPGCCLSKYMGTLEVMECEVWLALPFRRGSALEFLDHVRMNLLCERAH
jgi:hypothetical protein